MTSVAGGKSNFEENVLFLSFLGEQCKKMSTKSSKMFNYVISYRSSIKNFIEVFDEKLSISVLNRRSPTKKVLNF